MPDASYFADKARKCRELATEAMNPHLANQLRLWADEFDAMAQAFASHLSMPAAPVDPPETAEPTIIRPKPEGLA